MSNPNIDVLNDVTVTLIDSQNGYRKVTEIATESHVLRGKFLERQTERTAIIEAFQQRVRELGGDPTTSGGIGGAIHRAWTDFTTLFRKDEKAALEAVDAGEDHLADRIESKMQTEGLDTASIELLGRALTSARDGERFADMLADR